LILIEKVTLYFTLNNCTTLRYEDIINNGFDASFVKRLKRVYRCYKLNIC
jgi:hypothetical protein